MRILHFGKYAFERTGGIERHVEVLARAQVAEGADVTVLSYTSSEEAVPRWVDGVRVEPVRTLGRWSSQPIAPHLISRARSLMRQTPFDVVHQHWPDPFAHFAGSFLPGRVPFVVSWHSDIVRQRILGPVYRGLAPLTLRRPDAVIGATPTHMASKQIDRFAPPELRHVVAYGTELAPLELTEKVRSTVRRLRTRHEGVPIVFALGRHVYYKGFDVLIRAMAGVPAVLLLGGDGPLTPELKALAQHMHSTSEVRVEFTGPIDEGDLPAYYHACDVFCLPSVATTEAFGLVQTEAMACRKPVVNTALGTGVNEVAPDGLCALTVPPGDPVALGEALKRLIDHPELARQLGEAGRTRVESQYSVENMARQTLSIYGQLLGAAK